MLLGLSSAEYVEKKSLLEWLMRSLEGKARAFCKIQEAEGLPQALWDTLTEMAVQRYRSNGYGEAVMPDVVESITDGEQSVKYLRGAAEAALYAGLSDAEKAMLREWRRLW